MTSAIIYAFASAGFLGAGVVLAQLGLRTVEPLSGAAISVPSFTLLFLSPVVLAVQRVRKGSFLVQAPRVGLFWFAMTGISNGLSALTLFAAVRNGAITLVAPLAAIYPLVTVALSAILLKHIEITARIVAGTALTVLGVALVLIG